MPLAKFLWMQGLLEDKKNIILISNALAFTRDLKKKKKVSSSQQVYFKLASNYYIELNIINESPVE